MKQCNQCFLEKSLEKFYAHPRSKDGRGYKCIDCTKQNALLWKKENKQRYARNELRYKKASRLRDPSSAREIERRSRKNNPETRRRLQQRRRALLLDAFVEDVDNLVVFQKNLWVCQLCDKPVDAALKFPDPKSKSLDHIIPLSKGGLHSYANTQLAHFGCNSRKNNTIDVV